MTTVTVSRSDQDYADIAFAIKCMETGQARPIREKAGVNQLEMAKRIGVPSPYIFYWENNARLPIRHKVSDDIDRLEHAVAYGRELRKLSEATYD